MKNSRKDQGTKIAEGACKQKAPGPRWKEPGAFDIIESRQRPTLPLRHQSSTMGAGKLNFRVRDGNGCFLSAIVTEKRYTKFGMQGSGYNIVEGN